MDIRMTIICMNKTTFLQEWGRSENFVISSEQGLSCRAVMGAPAIYHMPSRRKSACSLVSNNVNGLDRRTTNYEKYLKVRKTYKSSFSNIASDDILFYPEISWKEKSILQNWKLSESVIC